MEVGQYGNLGFRIPLSSSCLTIALPYCLAHGSWDVGAVRGDAGIAKFDVNTQCDGDCVEWVL